MELFHWTLFYLVTEFVTNRVCKEYCQAKTFQPKCDYGEIILMTQALYGRMEEGKCTIKGKFGTGCHNNVIDVMDQLCSGRRECSVHLPHEALLRRNTCSGELVAYLEADYECVHVYKCQSSLVRITNQSGYLMVSAQTGCAFQLEVKKGQQIELNSLSVTARSNSPCPRVKVHEDLAGNQASDLELCSTGERRQHIYTSSSHRLTLHMIQRSPQQQYNNSQILVHYKAVGCADPVLPEGGVMTRKGDTVKVKCNTSVQAWHLVCSDTEWVGKPEHCLGAEQSMTTPPQKTFFQLKNGVLLAVLIGVALGVLVGVLLLVTYITISKMGKRKYETPREYIYPHPPRKACEIEDVGYHVQRPPPDNSATSATMENNNAHMQVQTFTKPPTVKCGVHVQL